MLSIQQRPTSFFVAAKRDEAVNRIVGFGDRTVFDPRQQRAVSSRVFGLEGNKGERRQSEY
jgi:hypothetical protein